jgi:alginate O-acetyltransferase complex protein AlgI
MNFISLTYALFLGAVFLLYWRLPRRGQSLLILIASYVFYGWWDYRFCALIFISSIIDFSVGLALGRKFERRTRRVLLAISLVANLGMLGFFKYFDFFRENLAQLGSAVGWQMDGVTLDIILPVGISFYTFQTMSYTIDVYRGHLKPTSAFVDYMAYVSFFPQLVAGPIERATSLLPQFLSDRSFDLSEARDGLRRILWGVAKKLILADNLAVIVELVYGNPGAYSEAKLVFATVCFAFQIYCDFSAYSDIAIGTAQLFGIKLMRNFAYPYFSQSVAEFWRRWHISLSTWFRDYVFIPLGGSRGKRRTMIVSMLITFVISGLWHGASWNFVIWGAVNGLLIVPSALQKNPRRLTVKDVPGGESYFPSVWVALKIGLTFGFICLGWVFFRAETLQDAWSMVVRMLSFWSWTGGGETLNAGVSSKIMSMLLAVFVAVEWMQRREVHALCRLERWPMWTRWLLYTLILWLAIAVQPVRVGDFIYFQF